MSQADDSSQAFEFVPIEEMDPSLSNGYRIIYDREVPLEIRHDRELRDNVSVDSKGIMESIKVKMLMQGTDEMPSSVKVELSSEADLFFHYVMEVEETKFREIQQTQKLMVDFLGYSSVLMRMLNACIREPHVHLGMFTLYADASARLDFIQNMEYKFVELMSCCLRRSPQDMVEQHISYRYNSMKQRLAITQARLFEISNLVKTKNPSLLLQLQKTTVSTGTMNMNSPSGSSSGTDPRDRRR